MMDAHQQREKLMQDPVNNILSRLDGVKEIKPDRWKAICPGHDDRNPSLSIGRGDDGRVLLKCWSGCESGAIVDAIGLDLKDLFLQPIKCHKPGKQRLYPNYRDILKLLRHEITVLWIIGEDMADGKAIPNDDMKTLRRAYSNIEKIMETANV